MRLRTLFYILIVLFFLTENVACQKVGIVFSGGGAAGFAHIGVLKALEEENIPIDYITGTSAGALIGAMYASGYSPNDMIEMALSNSFSRMTAGELEESDKFLLRKEASNASIFNLNFGLDSSFIQALLPTNFVNPSYLDYEVFQLLGPSGVAANHVFDSLMIPFRCVASDIYKKQPVILKKGDLNAAVRASLTFPLYINPIRIEDKLLFDGGLYNNFPIDALYQEYPVDYIIGSSVSANAEAPEEDDLINQLTNMLMRETNYGLPCENGIILRPPTEGIGTFEFKKVLLAIQKGYDETKKHIEEIKHYVERRISSEELLKKRIDFKAKVIPFKVDKITVASVKKKDVSFVKINFGQDTLKRPLSLDKVRKRYFRAYAAPQIQSIFPAIRKNTDSTYVLSMTASKKKPFNLRFGGHFSTRPVNTGYVGLSFYHLGNGAISLNAENYFGRFYGSTKIDLNYDLPTPFPIRVTPYFVLNSWDYYKSSTTFFEKLQPSFLVQNEIYYGINAATSIKNNSTLKLDFRKFSNKDSYYQSLVFSEGDTADITTFVGESASLKFELNSLNRKQWATEGSMFTASARYVQGKEKSLAGTTVDIDYDLRKFHNWINITLEGQKYFDVASFFKVGMYGKAVFNSQSLFANYTASVLEMTEFSPLPDSKTLFMEEYRAPQFIGGGLNLVFKYKFMELRLDSYFFQPFRQLIQMPNNQTEYSSLFKNGLPMIGGSLIAQTPIGPIRLSTNYFPMQKNRFITQLSFGYVLFNERAIR